MPARLVVADPDLAVLDEPAADESLDVALAAAIEGRDRRPPGSARPAAAGRIAEVGRRVRGPVAWVGGRATAILDR
ncbi:hypothetical protein GCM10022243_10750 [Saccharothrix violaceirubra]|uniref:Uncharacterized protein n=1 Tax=Saccharothrix violaceirubra TaxID=413306 RepID=A0A7W7T4C0_9PSEU|nr:hypothetical protein [Saccharothrix violaceirubra]MBB4966086.1 hypothetical protein [Saccharothrix violaceirubra]